MIMIYMIECVCHDIYKQSYDSRNGDQLEGIRESCNSRNGNQLEGIRESYNSPNGNQLEEIRELQ